MTSTATSAVAFRTGAGATVPPAVDRSPGPRLATQLADDPFDVADPGAAAVLTTLAARLDAFGQLSDRPLEGAERRGDPLPGGAGDEILPEPEQEGSQAMGPVLDLGLVGTRHRGAVDLGEEGVDFRDGQVDLGDRIGGRRLGGRGRRPEDDQPREPEPAREAIDPILDLAPAGPDLDRRDPVQDQGVDLHGLEADRPEHVPDILERGPT